MNTRKLISLSIFLSLFFIGKTQEVKAIYKINQLLNRIGKPDTAYVVNFWATWCKPCVQELPAFDSLHSETKNSNVKVILVCLDFKEELQKKVNPFLKKNNIESECVLLDEVNGNEFINKINPAWSGAIPATFFKKNTTYLFYEKKMRLAQLRESVSEVNK